MLCAQKKVYGASACSKCGALICPDRIFTIPKKLARRRR